LSSSGPPPTATYPDLMAICGERQFYDGRRDLVTNPSLIVEVLSDSTEAYDRGDKFRHYRNLQSLRAYLLLSQYRVQAELFLRQPDGAWSLSSYQDPSESVPLRVVEAELSLAEVYDKAARDYAVSILGEAELQHLRVEEVELADDRTKWLVTLGWVEAANRNVGVSSVYVRPTVEALPRVYKLFPVNAETGEVESMKMRH
jgi:hypothetical protein